MPPQGTDWASRHSGTVGPHEHWPCLHAAAESREQLLPFHPLQHAVSKVAAPNIPDLTLPAGAGRQAFAGSCRASPAWGAVYAWSNMWWTSQFRSSLLCFLFKPRDGARGAATGAGHCNILMHMPHQHVPSAGARVLSLLSCTCIVGLWLRVERLACNSIASCDAASCVKQFQVDLMALPAHRQRAPERPSLRLRGCLRDPAGRTCCPSYPSDLPRTLASEPRLNTALHRAEDKTSRTGQPDHSISASVTALLPQDRNNSNACCTRPATLTPSQVRRLIQAACTCCKHRLPARLRAALLVRTAACCLRVAGLIVQLVP